MNIRNYDSWKLHTPDDDLVLYSYCEYCENEIYVGEEYYDTDNCQVHLDCINEYAMAVLNATKRIAGE